MSERIVDAYCPECENIGSAERIVRHEEGYDKVLRVCRNCNAEFYHSWDRDWLADAKIKRLEAELERLREERDYAWETIVRMCRDMKKGTIWIYLSCFVLAGVAWWATR